MSDGIFQVKVSYHDGVLWLYRPESKDGSASFSCSEAVEVMSYPGEFRAACDLAMSCKSLDMFLATVPNRLRPRYCHIPSYLSVSYISVSPEKFMPFTPVKVLNYYDGPAMLNSGQQIPKEVVDK